MHQRNNNANASTAFFTSSCASGVQQSETVGARLVAFCTASSKSSSSSTNNIEHRYVPRPFIESNFLFESGLVLFKIVSLLLQYLLIYKSEKWLGPFHTLNDSFIHWHHIDRYVVLILSIFCLPLQEKFLFLRIFINIIALIYSQWIYSWKHVLVFTYPLVCALLVYQDQNSKSPSPPPPPPERQQQIYPSANTLPGHWCSTNASDLRNETECLRVEFNQRIRHILFSSFLSSYYICIVPLAFCDTHFIRLDLILLFQYGLTLFVSFIMIYTSHYLPLELLTVFHRNGKHLGSWQCLPSNHNLPLISFWDEKNPNAYETNSIVKYKRQIYRSSNTSSTVAEPGNIPQARFSILFSRSMVFPLVLCSLQLILLILQLTFLCLDPRWFVLFSQMIVFLFNTYTIHHTIRDMYLLYLVYCGE